MNPIGVIIFRSTSLTTAGIMLGRMFYPAGGAVLPASLFLVAVTIIGCILAGHLIGSLRLTRNFNLAVPAPVLGIGFAVFLLLIELLIPESAKPFIYFQF